MTTRSYFTCLDKQNAGLNACGGCVYKLQNIYKADILELSQVLPNNFNDFMLYLNYWKTYNSIVGNYYYKQ